MTSTYQGQTLDGRTVRLTVRGGTIVDVTESPSATALPYLLPVLVDAQQNGGLGTFYTQLHERGPDALRAMAQYLRCHGVGRCLMTMVTYPRERLKQSLIRIRQWLDADASLAALWPGIFHEGIYISPRDGWRGMHAQAWVEAPDWDGLRELDDASGGRIRVVNVAPEEPGGLAFVAQAVAAGKLVSLGHACPDAATVQEAVRRGATLVTHFGNGAASDIHRFRNPFWSYLNEPALRLGLVCDGFHLPPELVGVALKVKGPQGCFAVSDASGHSGCPPGEYARADGQPFVIEQNGHIHHKDSEMLAAAWFQIDRCVEVLIRTQGLSLPQAWAACSTIPAAIFGIALPTLSAGQEASFVLAHWDEGLVLDQCVHRGEPYLNAPIRPSDVGP